MTSRAGLPWSPFAGAVCATSRDGAHADLAHVTPDECLHLGKGEHTSTVASPRLHHLALTVTDVDASVRWYEDVFGIQFRMDVPHPGGVGKLLADDNRQLMIVLHRHDTSTGAMFGETVTGLDHAGFMVGSRSDLQAWQAHIEAKGVLSADVADKPLTQSPIADEPYASVLVFRDPDNIQLELFSPLK